MDDGAPEDAEQGVAAPQVRADRDGRAVPRPGDGDRYPRLRSSPFTTLPLALRGSSVTNSTTLGTL